MCAPPLSPSYPLQFLLPTLSLVSLPLLGNPISLPQYRVSLLDSFLVRSCKLQHLPPLLVPWAFLCPALSENLVSPVGRPWWVIRSQGGFLPVSTVVDVFHLLGKEQATSTKSALRSSGHRCLQLSEEMLCPLVTRLGPALGKMITLASFS